MVKDAAKSLETFHQDWVARHGDLTHIAQTHILSDLVHRRVQLHAQEREQPPVEWWSALRVVLPDAALPWAEGSDAHAADADLEAFHTEWCKAHQDLDPIQLTALLTGVVNLRLRAHAQPWPAGLR